jgi:hypothetical protein
MVFIICLDLAEATLNKAGSLNSVQVPGNLHRSRLLGGNVLLKCCYRICGVSR